MSETKQKPIRAILITLVTILIIGSVTLSLLPRQSSQLVDIDPTTQQSLTPTATAIPIEILTQLSEAEQAMNEENYQGAVVAYSKVLEVLPDRVNAYIQ